MKQPGTTTEGIHTYSTMDRQVNSEPLYFDHTQFDQPLTPGEQLIYERAGIELETAYTTELHSGKRRREVEYHVANNNDETASNLLFIPGFDQTVRNQSTARIVQTLAAKFPEKRIIILTTPGLDDTDRLPEEIRRSLRGGDFTGAGAYLLTALRPALQEDKPFDVLAYSQGSSFAGGIGAAAEPGEIRNMRLIDPAALEKRSLLGMYLASRASNAHAKEAAGELSPVEEQVLRQVEVARATVEGWRLKHLGAALGRVANESGGAVDKIIRIPHAMSRAGLMSNLGTALDKVAGEATLVVGKNSEYNRDLDQLQQRLRQALSLAAFGGYLQLGVFEGNHSALLQTHALAALAA